MIVAVLYALGRRVIARTPRLYAMRPAEQTIARKGSWEAVLILGLILAIMLGGLLYDAASLAAHRSSPLARHERDWAPLAGPLAGLLGKLDPRLAVARAHDHVAKEGVSPSHEADGDVPDEVIVAGLGQVAGMFGRGQEPLGVTVELGSQRDGQPSAWRLRERFLAGDLVAFIGVSECSKVITEVGCHDP